jgi:hypothetical protein
MRGVPFDGSAAHSSSPSNVTELIFRWVYFGGLSVDNCAS